MKRFVSLEEISDGKLYDGNSMARVDTCGCVNCHACCSGMGDSIVLDPFDIYNISKAKNMSQEEIIVNFIDIGIDEGMLKLSLKMINDNESCCFLNIEGRCSIHEKRPGICRLFPLGRFYHDSNKFSYFLQTNECIYENRIKTKISKWIGIGDLRKYENYISFWHEFIIFFKDKISAVEDREMIKQLNTYLLRILFINNYNDDFYSEFYIRLDKFRALLEAGI